MSLTTAGDMVNDIHALGGTVTLNTYEKWSTVQQTNIVSMWTFLISMAMLINLR